MVYVIDNYYAIDHLDYCRVVRTDIDDEHEVAELLVAIQLYFEETVDDTTSPELEDVVRLLARNFGFSIVDKDSYGNQIWEVMNYMDEVDYENFEQFNFGEEPCIYIDMYDARDSLLSQGDVLIRRWLTSKVKAEIKRLPCE